MGHAKEEPDQRRALERPAQGKPLMVELDREDQRDEKQRRAPEPGQLAVARGTLRFHSSENAQEAEDRWHRKERRDEAELVCHPWERRLHGHEDEQEVSDGSQGRSCPWQDRLAKGLSEKERIESEEGKHAQIPAERRPWIPRLESCTVPGHLQSQHAQKGGETERRDPRHLGEPEQEQP